MAFKKSGDVRATGKFVTVKEAQEEANEAKKARKRDKKDRKAR